MSANRFPFPTVLPQLLLGAGALALMAFAPPASGKMTIVSLAGQSGDEIARWSLDGQRALVRAGPHSLTVEGSRAGLVLEALRHGAMVVAARPALCGVEGAE
jgi:hypothetical protein